MEYKDSLRAVPDDRTPRRQWMAQQPATARQLTYLTQLGYDGPPPMTRFEASDAIQACLRLREVEP